MCDDLSQNIESQKKNPNEPPEGAHVNTASRIHQRYDGIENLILRRKPFSFSDAVGMNNNKPKSFIPTATVL